MRPIFLVINPRKHPRVVLPPETPLRILIALLLIFRVIRLIPHSLFFVFNSVFPGISRKPRIEHCLPAALCLSLNFARRRNCLCHRRCRCLCSRRLRLGSLRLWRLSRRCRFARNRYQPRRSDCRRPNPEFPWRRQVLTIFLRPILFRIIHPERLAPSILILPSDLRLERRKRVLRLIKFRIFLIIIFYFRRIIRISGIIHYHIRAHSRARRRRYHPEPRADSLPRRPPFFLLASPRRLLYRRCFRRSFFCYFFRRRLFRHCAPPPPRPLRSCLARRHRRHHPRLDRHPERLFRPLPHRLSRRRLRHKPLGPSSPRHLSLALGPKSRSLGLRRHNSLPPTRLRIHAPAIIQFRIIHLKPPRYSLPNLIIVSLIIIVSFTPDRRKIASSSDSGALSSN